LSITDQAFALATIHRAENTDDPKRLSEILDSFIDISSTMKIVWPVHPRTRNLLSRQISNPNLLMIEPVGYFDMLNLLANCRLVLTDSGGLQKEAYMMKKFCITIREQTEWLELVEAGVNKITDTTRKKITDAFHEFRQKEFPAVENFYGAGNAAELIVDAIIDDRRP